MMSPGVALVMVLATGLSLAAETGPELQTVIARANEAWVAAGRSLHKSDLEPFFSGKALTDLARALEVGHEDNFYIDFELLKVDYGATQVDPTGVSATVATTETWRSTSKRAGTGVCLMRTKPHLGRQTYVLTKTEGAWRITEIRRDANNTKAEKDDCPK